MIKLNLILITGLLVVGSAACSSDSKESKTTNIVQETVSQNPVLKKGESVFRANCMVCHQKNGQGIKGVNPPLANTEWVLGDKSRLINVVLKGLSGKIEIQGVKYNSMMTSFSYLSDEQISAVLTYIRQSFGNEASDVSMEEVATVRADNTIE